MSHKLPRPACLMVLLVIFSLSGCASSQAPPQTLASLFSAPGSLKDQEEANWTPQVIAAHQAVPQAPPAAARPAEKAHAPDCGSDRECLLRLKALIDDPDHHWIGREQPAADYAQGIRLFAYRALKSRLTCDELRLALKEIDAVGELYQRPVAGVSPDQTARVRILSAKVGGELRAERASRCSA